MKSVEWDLVLFDDGIDEVDVAGDARVHSYRQEKDNSSKNWNLDRCIDRGVAVRCSATTM